MFPETDSLFYEIVTKNMHKKTFGMTKNGLLFIWIFIKDSEYYDPTTKKALEEVKDEASSKKIINFAVKSELYNHLVPDVDHDVNNKKLFK